MPQRMPENSVRKREKMHEIVTQRALTKLSPQESHRILISLEPSSANSIHRQGTDSEGTSFGKEELNATGPHSACC
jgi:hypothetical protein